LKRSLQPPARVGLFVHIGQQLLTLAIVEGRPIVQPTHQFRRGFRVVGVPVRLDEADGRATSHYRPIVDSLRIAGAVARARFEAPA
jgi:hypothetical protein